MEENKEFEYGSVTILKDGESGDSESVEFLFEDTDIFDLDINKKVEKNILLVNDQLSKEFEYSVEVSFNVELLKDLRFDKVDVKVNEWNKNETRKDKIYNLLGFQLDSIGKAISNSGLQTKDMSIKGELLEVLNVIKVKIEKKEPIQNKQKTKKKSKPLTIRCIMPNEPYINDTVSKLASERLNKIYSDLRGIVRDKKIMSEALDIEQTDDENVLFQAFVKQYKGLWLSTSEKEKALFDTLKEKILSAAEKRIQLLQESDKKES